jgi:hypothetical protein
VQNQGEIQASRRIRVRKKKIARATHRESIHAYVRACEYIAKLGGGVGGSHQRWGSRRSA